jgi:hypothetical protein
MAFRAARESPLLSPRFISAYASRFTCLPLIPSSSAACRCVIARFFAA